MNAKQTLLGEGRRILLTGANGFVGRRTSSALEAAGYRVRHALRSTPRNEMLTCQDQGLKLVTVGDIGPGTSWEEALSGVDAVVHLAARVHVMNDTHADPLAEFRRVNVGGTETLARAAARLGVRRLVFVSSIKVNGEATVDVPFSEQSTPAPVDPYGISKWEAEQALLEVAAATGLEVVIVRPPLMYGPGVKANFLRLVRAVARGAPLPLGLVQNRRSLLFVDNLADAIVHCVRHPSAAGNTFLISDGAPVSSADLVRSIGRALGKYPRLLPIPPSWLRLVGRAFGREDVVRRLLSSLVVDDRRIRDVLQWSPPYTAEQGLAETVDWWRFSTND